LDKETTVRALIDMESARIIRFYSDRESGDFLSNFHVGPPIWIDGQKWASVEHYYQAMKFHPDAVLQTFAHDRAKLENIRREIGAAPTPLKAKRLGAGAFPGIHCAERWAAGDPPLKEVFMWKALTVKFAAGGGLAKRLLSTGSAQLVEENPADPYWGIGPDGAGLNLLGELLMRLRDQLADVSSLSNIRLRSRFER
jgi:ribA/ribD-fused uncharacterized protein